MRKAHSGRRPQFEEPAMSIPRRPYKITALGHFKPDPDPRESTRPIPVDLYTIDQALAKIKPRMSINVDRGQCPGGFLDLQLEALGHFKPDHAYVQGNACCSNAGEYMERYQQRESEYVFTRQGGKDPAQYYEQEERGTQ